METAIDKKINDLKKIIASYNRVAVAFSGGIDSSLLVYIVNEIKNDKMTAIIAKTVFNKQEETEFALNFCKKHNIKYTLINFGDTIYEELLNNPVDRCYKCKKNIFGRIVIEAEKLSCDVIFDGSNKSDLKDYRPGKKALSEFGIVSPFNLADIDKEDIRMISKKYGFDFWDKPSESCLVTRIPYDKEVTLKELKRIEEAENIVHNEGFKIVRVRVYDDIAVIETGHDELDKILNINMITKLKNKLNHLGFAKITINIDGYESGNMNTFINKKNEGTVSNG